MIFSFSKNSAFGFIRNSVTLIKKLWLEDSQSWRANWQDVSFSRNWEKWYIL